MRIIRDFKAAKAALSRQPWAGSPDIPPALKQRIKEAFGKESTPEEFVESIVEEVRCRGDAALFDYGRRLDGTELRTLEVGREEIARSRSEVSQELVSALELAAEKIRSFHLAQRDRSVGDFRQGGVGQLVRPLERVGAYVPGGAASYPSTVLMTVIPARVAGVKEVVVATPPGTEGAVPPATLLACDIAGADRIFKIGGAQAIAALAFGTESVPRVDKVCGPGNIFVQLAKRIVYGAVGIDGLYGPTETIVIADGSAAPAVCALDLLAQAEHDPLASAILITTSAELASRVEQEVARRLAEMRRGEIAASSLEERGIVVVVADMEQAVELANDFAPEHLSLMVDNAAVYVNKLKNAGGIFIGEDSPEVLGDYVAGPSHVMPTGGTARFGSPLTIYDFLKITSVVSVDRETLKTLGPSAATIARAEGLDAHAQAVDIRLSPGEKES